VTAGPTREALDPARFLSNPSTGKMGYALAAEAVARGGEVTLVSGPTHLAPPPGVNLVRVTTAEEMFRAALNQAPGADLVLKAAAVADYRPEERARCKIKKETLRRRALKERGADRAVLLRLLPTPDILEELGRRKRPGQVLVGFAAETGDLASNALRKLRKKNLDLVVANRIGQEGEGFEADTNRALVIDRNGRKIDLPKMSKEAMAVRILDLAERLLQHVEGRSRRRAAAAREGAS
jgi:phosphopantothenoylcysteine decarboxylase/phosphopantothenate--cysteine ligase